MSVKVSELTASTGITSDDLLLTVNDPGGTPQSRKATAQQMLDYVTGSTFNTLTVTSLTSSNVQLSGNFSGTFVGDGSGLTGLSIPTNNFTLGSTNIVLGTTASLVEGLTTLTSSNVTGSTAKFTTISGTNANISGDLTVAGILTATEYHTTVVSASIIYQSGSTKFGNDSGDTHQFSGSVLISGTLNANSTISGTTAQFTTVTASTLSVSGGNLIIYETASIGDYAYILYNGTYDKLVAFPGLYVSGNLTGSGHAKFNEVSGTTAQFTVVSASVISASSYIGLPTSSGGTPGGTNTTVQFNSGSTFSGSSNLVWDYTNERLGIGITNPSFKADIRGNTTADLYVGTSDTTAVYLSASNTGAGGYTLLVTADGSGAKIKTNSSARDLQLGTNSTTALTIDTSQRVGIGTTSPGTKLQVIGDATVGNPDTTSIYLTASNGGGYSLVLSADSTGAKVETNVSSRDLRLGTNNITALTIDTSQRVGIGTTSPQVTTEIVKGTQLTKLSTDTVLFVSNNTSTTTYIEIANTTTGASGIAFTRGNGTGNSGLIDYSNASNKMTFYTADSARAVIDTNGNVGIGTSTPSEKLHVAAGSLLIDGGGDLKVKAGTIGSNGIIKFYKPDSSYNSGIYFSGSNNVLRIGDSTGTDRLIINDNGNVGINKDSSNSTLDVNGNTIISGNLTVTGSIFVSGSSIYGQVAELTSSTTNYTLVRQDSGKFLNINSGSAVTVTVPTGLPTGFTVSLCQLGAGQVTVSGAVGVTINNRQSHTKTAGQYAVVSLVGTSADTYVFVGDTTA